MFYKLILLCVCIVHIYNIFLVTSLSSLSYTHKFKNMYKYNYTVVYTINKVPSFYIVYLPNNL